MVPKCSWHGNPTYFDQYRYVWRYCVDDCPVKDDPQRPCNHCGLATTDEGHDGCLGTLPGVMNACCGHGIVRDAYIQFPDSRETIRGNEAIEFIKQLKDSNDSIHGKTQDNKILVTKQI